MPAKQPEREYMHDISVMKLTNAETNNHHFADIFKLICLNEMVEIRLKS